MTCTTRGTLEGDSLSISFGTFFFFLGLLAKDDQGTGISPYSMGLWILWKDPQPGHEAHSFHQTGAWVFRDFRRAIRDGRCGGVCYERGPGTRHSPLPLSPVFVAHWCTLTTRDWRPGGSSVGGCSATVQGIGRYHQQE